MGSSQHNQLISNMNFRRKKNIMSSSNQNLYGLNSFASKPDSGISKYSSSNQLSDAAKLYMFKEKSASEKSLDIESIKLNYQQQDFVPLPYKNSDEDLIAQRLFSKGVSPDTSKITYLPMGISPKTKSNRP